jgi:adenylate cyclase
MVEPHGLIPGAGIPSSPAVAEDPDVKLSRDLLMFAAALMGFAAMLWVAIYKWMGTSPLATEIPFGYLLASACSFGLYWKTKNFALFRVIQLSMFLFVPFMMQWAIGSFVSSSGIMLWAILAPIGALVFHGLRESLPWIIAYLIFTAASGVSDYLLADSRAMRPTDEMMKSIAVFFVLNFAAISTIVYFLMRYFINEKSAGRAALQQEHALLEAEQERAQKLLLNVLPAPIAERLKREEKTIADGFADVTVMFADLVNFTRLAEELSPNRIVAMLNQVFSRFDELAERHGLEKIKTIGDAYMLAGGLALRQDHDYAAAAAEMAFEMREAIGGFAPLGGQPLQIRIGVATGPAVAGVIGTKKFIYDLWGDTVNIASRIHSEAVVNSVLVDTTTYKRLYTRYRFSAPRLITVKGKGELQVYELLARHG